MPVSIASRVYRTLAHLESFKLDRDVNDVSELAHLPFVSAGEQLIGIYHNVPGSLDRAILFTNCGVYLNDSGVWQSVKYGDLVSAEIGDGAKNNLDKLILQLRSGQTQILPVLGGGDKFRDAFEMLRFFIRVISDAGPQRIS